MITQRDAEIIVVGSHAPGLFVRVKHIPKPGETVLGWDFHEPMDGGKGSNQAIAAARLGGSVAFVGCVGKDRIGESGEQWMKLAGVNTTFLKHSEHMTSGVGFIILDEDGVPAMVTSMGANTEITKLDIDQAINHLSSAKVLLTQFEIDREIALYAARKAKDFGMTTIVNPAPAMATQKNGFQGIDYLIPNEVEAMNILGMDSSQKFDPFELASNLRAESEAKCVIVTLGQAGYVGSDSLGIWGETPLPVEVVDTSGAGDVFCSALAVSLVNNISIREATAWACKAATLSVTRPGTIPAFPLLEEVSDIIKLQANN